MTHRIDARGLRCPWPAIRLSRALRDGMTPPIEIEADDPAAEGEIRLVANQHGHAVEKIATGHFRLP
ncbi:sulfurtransferase TusA family protein [Sphingomonas sp. BGYR3]|uniref:sulfurtransferase TusA family protein n=1 Tax=Sphingomonas sp. BGYR3 TaxID=2975483 RepID=UPI0021A800F7|nr:sulfurtransferase TusA family protein [Sphingomonas sp. BGYR3]MDG5487611.1 sulfurtransferase TusA family protein [Sphingomonas sp. BGYR3]